MSFTVDTERVKTRQINLLLPLWHIRLTRLAHQQNTDIRQKHQIFQILSVKCIMRSFRNIISYQINEDEMSGACSMDRRDEKCIHTIFWLENLEGRDHFEDLSIDGRIILE
jgi:hypothetical protein